MGEVGTVSDGSADGPVMALRRVDVGRTRREVHVAPVPADPADAVTALCGLAVPADGYEVVAPGVGMPCVTCLLAAAPRALTSY